MKKWLQLSLAAAGFALVARADAHAFLDHAVPAVGSAVHAPPAEVKLWFSQLLEPAFSTIKVVDREGRTVDAGDKAVDPNDRKVLRVSLKPLPPGTYRVVWRVLSIDTHVTEGEFTFDIAK